MVYLIVILSMLLNSSSALEIQGAFEIQSPNVQQDSTQYLIAKGQVGDLRIGHSADELYSIFEYDQIELVDLFLEGFYSPALKIVDQGRISLVAELNCDKIYRVRVYSERYHTERDIRIGSTFDDLRSHYTINEILYGEGSVYAYVDDLNMSFELDLIPTDSYQITIENIPDGTRISTILVL